MMLSAKHQQQWNKILNLTQQMHNLAAEDEWEKVLEIESLRGTQLAVFFKIKLDAEAAAEIAKDIQKILAKDRELAITGLKAKQEVVNSVASITSGRQAVAAYDHCR